MMSKKLLSQSLFSVYKTVVSSTDEESDKDLIKEIKALAQSPEFFTEKEIAENNQRFANIENVAEQKHFVCHIDGSLKVRYKDRAAKTGKTIKAGSSFIVESNNKTLIESYFRIPDSYKGTATNTHITEYQALISCLRVLSLYHPKPEIIEVELFTDSEVLTKQMDLEVRVRDDVCRSLRSEAQNYMKLFKSVSIIHCPRDSNERADRLAKKSLREKDWTGQAIGPAILEGVVS